MKYLKVFTDFAQAIEPFSDEEVGRLFRGMLQYADIGTEPDLVGNEKYIWNVAKLNIDMQKASYDERCATNKRIANSRIVTKRDESLRNVTIGNESSEDKDKDKDKRKNKKSSRECTPSDFNEVVEFSNTFDKVIPVSECEKFFDYYSSNGWKVSGRTPMKDWKASFRNWIKNAEDRGMKFRNKEQKIDTPFSMMMQQIDARENKA